MELEQATIIQLEEQLDKKKNQREFNLKEFEKKIKHLTTFQLIKLYPEINDDESISFMDEFWNRFPFDVLDDQYNMQQDTNKELRIRISNIEKEIKLQTRVLDRIDKLIKAINRCKK